MWVSSLEQRSLAFILLMLNSSLFEIVIPFKRYTLYKILEKSIFFCINFIIIFLKIFSFELKFIKWIIWKKEDLVLHFQVLIKIITIKRVRLG